MTQEEAIKHGKEQLDVFGGEHYEFIKMAIKALETESLTDTEQRIFLAAMGKEESVCREVYVDNGVDLVTACYNIKRKVKAALWK